MGISKAFAMAVRVVCLSACSGHYSPSFFGERRICRLVRSGADTLCVVGRAASAFSFVHISCQMEQSSVVKTDTFLQTFGPSMAVQLISGESDVLLESFAAGSA